MSKHTRNEEMNTSSHLDLQLQSSFFEVNTLIAYLFSGRGSAKKIGKLSQPFVTFPVCWLVPKQVLYHHPGNLAMGLPSGEINTEIGIFSTGAESLG